MRFLFLLSILFYSFNSLYSQGTFSIVECKTEYMSQPIGIDNVNPRLTWKVNTQKQGFRQLAYKITVSPDSLGARNGSGSMWESGWIESDRSLIPYEGKSLLPFTKYYWRIDVRGNDKSEVHVVNSFETGMLNTRNWKGAWISDSEDIQEKRAPVFRKEFSTKRDIRSATVYVAVAGLVELYINGAKVGNHSLDPAYTRYDRRILYSTHDVTSLLSNGQNTIGVLLGNGWYNHQSTAVWNFHKAPWRNRPAFCLDLRITYTDGTVETISSGKSWKTTFSPIIFNSIYTGEHADARKELEGWNKNGCDERPWKPVILRTAPSQNIVSQTIHPIRKTLRINARSIKKQNDTTYIFDFGRNISGVSEITLSGRPGTVIRLKHGERLGKDGKVDVSNIDVHYRPQDNTDPFQTDIYILKGSGDETFSPRFNYKGFQFVEVTSSEPVQLNEKSVIAWFMHSDIPVAGNIQTSNPTLNKIWEATNASYLSNMFGYPTDCPQREKNGWTGDAIIACETGLYNFDGITVYEKWLADHRDEQQPNGVLPSIIPTGGWGYEWGNGPDWTSSVAIIPWNIYLFYGDKKLLEDSYENIKRYIDHISEISPGGLTSWGLGDWVPVKSKSPVELTSTCYYYADVMIASRAASILNKPDEQTKYLALAAKIKDAFNAKYLNTETGVYGSGTQTELSVPLYWQIVPDELKEKVSLSLAKRVEQDQFQLDVGLLGQKAILNALSENGYADYAYRLASRESYPSWGWWIRNGATTLYENWDIAAKNDISMNHIMFGEVGAWLYKGIGGIYPDMDQPGFKHIIFKPNFVNGLTQFSASHQGPYGLIKSEWLRKGSRIVYTVEVPANATATVHLSQRKKQKVKLNGKAIDSRSMPLTSGSHTIEIEEYK